MIIPNFTGPIPSDIKQICSNHYVQVESSGKTTHP